MADDRRELREAVDAIRWYHRIDLGGGVVTPGLESAADRLALLGLPDDLSGLRVLDVGAWDGAFSFECERRGAARVVAADWFAWHGDNWSTKAGFELARRTLGSEVSDVDVDVMDLSPEAVGGTYDVVLFLGVLYHLRHPLLALERVASVVAPGGTLILETHVDLAGLRRPAMAFYPRGTLRGDPTNWWGPNIPAVVEMLRAVGFDETDVRHPRSAAYSAARMARRVALAARDRLWRRPADFAAARQGRAVVHARRARG